MRAKPSRRRSKAQGAGHCRTHRRRASDARHRAVCGRQGRIEYPDQGAPLEYGPAVRVNAIMAGPFWTDISKAWREELDGTTDSAVRRIGRPHEAVTAALYLASDQSSFMTGSIIVVSGGIR